MIFLKSKPDVNWKQNIFYGFNFATCFGYFSVILRLNFIMNGKFGCFVFMS